MALALIERAAVTPDRAAAWDVDRCLTYAELEAQVSSVAGRIAERRGKLGTCGVLPLVVGRDLGSLVAINAAIRAGVPFTPLDAGLSRQALAQFLHRIDDPTVAVVGDADGAAALPAGVEVISALGARGGGLDPVPVQADAMARLLFTSGSTGEPKGVMSSWASIDGFLDDRLMAPPPGIADPRGLGIAPMSFAAGVVVALRPALGTAVSLLDPNAHDPLDLLERVDADRLTSVSLVPSHILTVLDRWPSGRRLEHVRLVTTFGEPLEWSMVPTIRRLLTGSANIINIYGATEGGVGSLGFVIGADTPIGTGRVPLGVPLDPEQVRLEPISDAADGADPLYELTCRGPRVALGYWREPELTARAFGTDEDGTRVWRSGDLVRQDADGIVAFVGRRDNVVKINGKLVEPSEPERVIGAFPGIRRAVVLVQPAPRGGQRLVAHVEVEPDATLDPADVRRGVSEQVAAHLVPAVMVRHDVMPLTDRGKIDRQALVSAPVEPWRDRASVRRPEAFEVAALGVVADVLGVDGLGPDDDLWSVGLDSLGATELLSALQDFGWPAMPESVLLEHRTVAALNQLRLGFIPTGKAIWVNAQATGVPVVCVLPAAGDALTFRRLAQEIGPGHPVGIVRQFDPLSSDPPLRTVPDLAAGVRGTVGPTVGRRAHVVVGYSASGVVAYEYARQCAADGIECRVVLLDCVAGALAFADLPSGLPRGALPRRLRRAARQAWLRALPAMSMPQRERSYALYEIANHAMVEFSPPVTDLAVTFFRATRADLPSPIESWGRVVSDLAVVDLDCDHFEILDVPHITAVAQMIHGAVDPLRRPV
jgi:acyl-coenzyme A synthetase/AMP-(fatty) acid ligase/thioesterase domain-containing protein